MKASYAAGDTDINLLETTIGNMFDETAEAYPRHEALVVKHQDIRWTYARYQEEVNRLATGLIHLGISAGDRVGIWAPNCYEWCLTQFATAKTGAIMVCLNPAYRLRELEYALNKSQCAAIISAEAFKTSQYLQMLRELAPEIDDCLPGNLVSKKLPYLNTIIRMGAEASKGMFNFDDVCSQGRTQDYAELERRKVKLKPSDTINIQFTSGTTGSPKGAALTHHNILNNGYVVGQGMNFSPEDNLCIPVPLYHCFGMVLGNLVCVTHGATAVFPNAIFDPVSTLQAVEEEKCTALHGVPTMFIAELNCPEFKSFDFKTLRTGLMAGALCPEPTMRSLMSEMNMDDILIAYGQTETSPVNHMTLASDPIEKRVQTVGRAGPHLEIKIVDATGRTLDVNQPGEICCRGYAVMKGYWDDEAATESTIDADRWLHSGDIGVMDNDGYVQITGRIKDMIIRGGENVYPKEIEDFLYAHPKIEDVQVFGIPDTKYGEQVCAWVKLQKDESMSEAELAAYCSEQIAHFKIPSRIRFVTEYPMTVTGKIQKFKMREVELEFLPLPLAEPAG